VARLLIMILVGLLTLPQSWGASCTGRITFVVVRTLQIQVLSEMIFPPSTPGAEKSVISPESESSGKFVVQGQQNMSVSIILPKEVLLQLEGDSNTAPVRITDFISNVGQTGNIPSSGQLVVAVGASREALSPDQKEGRYRGSYTVQVVY
jgi:hypothetical protein